MKKSPKIPDLCACGCNNIVWNGNVYIQGHNARGFPEEYYEKLRMFTIGSHHSDETKKLLSFQKLGDKNPSKRLEVRAKISASLTGKTQSHETISKRIITQKGTPQKNGWKLSAETKYRMSISRKGKKPLFMETMSKEEFSKMVSSQMKKLWTDTEYRRKQIEKRTGKNHSNYGKHRSKETRDKISTSLMGENHPNWKGGKRYEPYCYKFNERLKERIRDRDNRTCQLCSVKENGVKLSVHHIHYDKENCDPDLISLCKGCNSKVNSNRDYYEKTFIGLLISRGLAQW